MSRPYRGARAHRLAPFLALLVISGCTSPETPPAWKHHAFDAAPPHDAGRARRKKIVLPPPMMPPPRPAGEPRTPEDLSRLSQQAASGQPADQPGAPPIQRIDEFRLRVGQVFVDRKARKVEMPARVNMTEGILEYYAVGSNGKLHESVLELLPEPSHLHLALLLIGLEPTVWDPATVDQMPKAKTLGSPLELWVEWDADGEHHRARAESWLYNRGVKAAPTAQAWVFQGSTFWNNRYAADTDRSVIGLIPDSQTVINIVGDIGNPYRGDAQGYEVYTAKIPPKGTSVTVVIEPRAAEAPATPPPAP